MLIRLRLNANITSEIFALLIDGNELTDLMFKYNVSISNGDVFITKNDLDFFEIKTLVSDYTVNRTISRCGFSY